MSPLRSRELLPLGLLGAILGISMAWWALALWPLPDAAPLWLARTRWVCFGSTATGLPNGGGWLLLVGQPLSMLATLGFIWGDALRDGLALLWRHAGGRRLAIATVGVVVTGLGAAAVRVTRATAAERRATTVPLPRQVTRIDRRAPPLALVDQHGQAFSLSAARGRPVLVTFAFGHCTTVCPLVIHDALQARALAPQADPLVVVVTLDPWRDTPARLPALARQWGLTGDAVALSGPVVAVEAALNAWAVGRARDPGTGDITHPALIAVVDRTGRLAYTATGDGPTVAALLRTL